MLRVRMPTLLRDVGMAPNRIESLALDEIIPSHLRMFF